MIGFAAIFLALIMTGTAAFAYFSSHLGQMSKRSAKAGSSKRGFMLYKAAACLIGVAAVYLLYLLLTDQFQYAYVFGYSEKNLSLPYKISAFWAGQEGSFMLWLVFHALFGVIIGRKPATAPAMMMSYCILQLVLLTIILAKSPFMMLPEVRPDGAGLNPLLMDPWMVIHPPIIFLGYAALAIPFSYAIGALLTDRHTDWIDDAMPWAHFAWCALGVGIFVGGFWAYKVLGWGGYWAWDPVENASLVPWLICCVMLHLFLIAKVRPGAIKPTYLATIFTFIMVLYGTFLTRSGVLSDFSTHSFANEGYGSLLAALVAIVLIFSLILLVIKWPKAPDGVLYETLKSREFITLVGLLAVCALAVLITIGMSTPLITMLLGNTQNVSTSFYNNITLPLTALLLIGMTLASIAKWGESDENAIKAGALPLSGAIITVIAATSFGVSGFLPKAVLGLTAAATIANISSLHKGLSKVAAITHIGVAVLTAGIIVSSLTSQSQTINVEQSQSVQVFGQVVNYQGVEVSQDQKVSYQNFAFGSQAQSLVQTLTRLSKDGKTAAREPGIYRTLGADYYITPVLKDEHESGTEILLSKGETAKVDSLAIRFDKFGMNDSDPKKMRAYAQVVVNGDNGSETISPELVYVNGHFQSIPVQALGHYEVRLNALNTKEGKVKLGVTDTRVEAKPEKIDIEVSQKPFISLVWLGCTLISGGVLAASYFRIKGK